MYSGYIEVIPSPNKPKIHNPIIGQEPISLFEIELTRLERKYDRSILTVQELAKELGLNRKTIDERIKASQDIPEYKELRTGKKVFPIHAVAAYLTQSLVKAYS